MNKQELERVCDLEHKLRYKIVHKNEKLFPTLIIYCCNTCVDKYPFNALPKEPITQNE